MNSVVWRSVRRVAYADYHGGRFVAVADANQVILSSDGGRTWWWPDTTPSNCTEGAVSAYGDILYGNGTFVIVGYAGVSCYSQDGGTTWASTPTGLGEVLSRGVFTGTEFRLWGRGVMISSTDGIHWATTPLLPAGTTIEGPVAFSPVTGTYVAIANLWHGYADQQFLRSTDGVTWQALAAGTFAPSHPIMYMGFGYVDASAGCHL
jgi:hypothetical protein